jgi:hypothetical protein
MGRKKRDQIRRFLRRSEALEGYIWPKMLQQLALGLLEAHA